MFERFTDRARRVTVLAQEESRRLGHPHVGDEHLLLAMAGVPDSTAGRVLAEVGLDADRLRERLGPTGDDAHRHHAGHTTFTSLGRRVLEGAVHEANALHARQIGTEHLLLSLTRVDGAGVAVLQALEVNVDDVHDRAARAATTGGDSMDDMPVETQATPWSAPRADMGAQLASIESTLRQILDRLAAIERKLPAQ